MVETTYHLEYRLGRSCCGVLEVSACHRRHQTWDRALEDQERRIRGLKSLDVLGTEMAECTRFEKAKMQTWRWETEERTAAAGQEQAEAGR